MRPKYYKIPIDTRELFKRKKIKPKLYVSLKKSIDEHLQLLFMTAQQELRFDHNYGTVVSSLDYSTEKQTGIFERSIEHSIYESITQFEPRLKDLNVKVKYDKGGELITSDNKKDFKVYITIQVQAVIKQLNEQYKNVFKIFFSPLTES